MRYVLDTNAVVRLLDRDPRFVGQLAVVGTDQVGIPLATASPAGLPEQRTLDVAVVAERIPIVVEPEGAGSARAIVATQSYVKGEWRSQVSAFDTATGHVTWQSEQLSVPYARGMRACRHGQHVVVADEKGNVSALDAQDGHVAWRASVGAEVATCCSTESSLASGVVGELVLTTVGHVSYAVARDGSAREVERARDCHPLPSDCKTCQAGASTRVARRTG